MTHLVPVLRPVLGTPFRRGDLYRRAGEVPSFHIAPARTGNARDLITGNLLGTYNSASPAWAVGPDGVLFQPAANAPVIEYDPTTLQCLGARIWEVVVNLSLQSRDLTQAAWTKSGVTPTRDQVGANGVSNTATRLTATSSDGTCLQTITSASATRVSGFYIRRITGTGTVEITQNGGATWTAVSLTSTFARYSIASATITNPQIGFRIRSNGDEIAVDFAQLQSSAILGPPVATAGLTASSTADVWTIGGSDFTRIWNTSAGTMYFDGSFVQTAALNYSRLIAAVGANPGTDEISIYTRIAIGVGDGRFFGNSCVGGSDVFTLGDQNSPRANSGKAAFAFTANDAALYDGAILTTDNTGSLPTVQELRLMGQARFQGQPVGYIREAAIFRSRRPNANLQAMAS